MKYDISVIVPVYNCENILPNNMGNLLNQTKREIEIIFSDDASTDGSLRVLKDAKNSFGDRVKILEAKTNKGPGVARNLALEIASGDYIGFMDADDLIDVSMYEKLYNEAIKTGADITDCAFLKDSSNAASIHFSSECIGELDDKKKSILISCGGYNVTKLFKRELLDGIRFRPAYTLEDTDFLVKALMKAKRVASVEEVLYRYRDTEGSLSKEDRSDEYVRVQIEAMRAVYNAAKDYGNYSGIQDATECMLLCMYKNIAIKLYGNWSDPKFAEARQLRFDTVKKSPSANSYAKIKLDSTELKLIKAADRYK